MMKRPFFTWEGDNLVLNILGTPNSKKDAIGKGEGPSALCQRYRSAASRKGDRPYGPFSGRRVRRACRGYSGRFRQDEHQQAAPDQSPKTPAVSYQPT